MAKDQPKRLPPKKLTKSDAARRAEGPKVARKAAMPPANIKKQS